MGISRDDVLALTRAVVCKGGHVRYLSEINTVRQEWGTVEEAAESGRAFLVDPKDTLLVVDVDLDSVTFTAEYVVDWLDAHGYGDGVVRVASGRTTDEGMPHEHIWVFAPKGQRELLKAGLMQAGISNIRAGMKMRPPLSPHRSGRTVALIAPESVAEALVRLGPPDVAGSLSDNLLGLVVNGDTKGRHQGRHGTLFAIALGFQRKRRGFDEYRVMMLNPAHKGAAKLHEDIIPNQGMEAAGRELWNAWQNAGRIRDTTEDFTTDTARERIGQFMRDAVLCTPWPGVSKSFDLRVLMGLAWIAYERGHPVQAPSLRTLAVESCAGNPHAVSKSLGRLGAAGWIQELPPDGGTKRFRLNLETYPRDNGATSIDCPPYRAYGCSTLVTSCLSAVFWSGSHCW